MSRYRKFGVAFWEGEYAAAFAGDGDLIAVSAYLISNRYNSFGLGLYRLPLAFVEDGTGIAIETCRRCVSDASEAGFARYDDATKTIFVVEQARHEWGESPNVNRNDVKGMLKSLPDVLFDLRKSSLINDFCERYWQGWREILMPIMNASDTRLERVGNASERRFRSLPPDPDPDPDPDPETGSRKPEEDLRSEQAKPASCPMDAQELSGSRKKMAAVMQIFADLGVEPPKKQNGNGPVNYGTLGQWLKTCDGDVGKLRICLERLQGSDRMGAWPYFFTVLPDWANEKAAPKRKSSIPHTIAPGSSGAERGYR